MPLTSTIPIQKLGTPFQCPDWRFRAACDPRKFFFSDRIGLADYRPVKGNTRSHPCKALKRKYHEKVADGPQIEQHLTYTQFMRDLIRDLPAEQGIMLHGLWRKHRKQQGIPLISFISNKLKDGDMVWWDAQKISSFGDEYFLKVVSHIARLEYYSEINFAMVWARSPEISELFRVLGYLFYAGISEMEVAKRWKIPLKKVEAIHKLFFDFSHFPRDRTLQWALLRQLENSKILQEGDSLFYRKIFDLGELGLRAQTDYLSLTEDEKTKIKYYLRDTVVLNAFYISSLTNNTKEAYKYLQTIMEFEKLQLAREELKYKETNTRLVETKIQVLGGQVNVNNQFSEADQKFFADYLRTKSLENSDSPVNISIEDLNNPQKVIEIAPANAVK